MEPQYSVIADILSKFHTWPLSVQALCVAGLTAVVITAILGITRVMLALVDAFHDRKPAIAPPIFSNARSESMHRLHAEERLLPRGVSSQSTFDDRVKTSPSS